MLSDLGTYALILASAETRRLRIGRLGDLAVRPGWYVYVGSAFGPGGVGARLAHHRKRAARPHWHVDHLRLHTRLERVWFTHDPVRREHQWAQVIQQLPGAEMPRHGFGSSDCTCVSHLVYFVCRPSFRRFQRAIRSLFPEHAPIRSIVAAQKGRHAPL